MNRLEAPLHAITALFALPCLCPLTALSLHADCTFTTLSSLQGIITERDILLKHDFDDQFCARPVGDLMTSHVEVADPS